MILPGKQGLSGALFFIVFFLCSLFLDFDEEIFYYFLNE